ncbi:right-handed parallel beta-helix repeat-containing protein [Horticoccus luteus]|uniref:Right-handed parallel beta-helix repeat-containing protein n=1 Tax=Horticoccus luteus TaxID=2862869 RepID=A0A8F9TVN5_9BACT|nr:right-handed parallel beta-helix repeat-containing protein [Horticoccus luteus]QYM78618.1 right-handed parallel beta-helix repeat-containing protein [Horticoccus luteus]
MTLSPPTKFLRAILGGVVGAVTLTAAAATFHVSPHGADDAAGTAKMPWRTLARAGKTLAPGDKCLVHAGTYRETLHLQRSGTANASITYAAAGDGDVIIDGSDLLRGAWQVYRERIHVIELAGPVRQVFVGEEQQTWARWPNANPHNRWDRNTWASTGLGSRYGLVIDPALAETHVDWTGATAVLNVAHQFLTWTRRVQACDTARGAFTYARDLTPITNYADKTTEWEDDRFYLVGKLEALDAPGEWFFDAPASRLYFWAPGGADPNRLPVTVKRRALGLRIDGAHHITVRGFRFVGCTVQVRGDDNEIADCELRHPVYAFHMSEPAAEQADDRTAIDGDRNVLRHCTISGANTSGLLVRGSQNLIEDCVIHDACWDGSLAYAVVSIDHPDDDKTRGNTLRHCTIFDGGNTLVRHAGPGNVIEYCDIHDGGRVAKDVALVQGGSPRVAGSVVRYNWVHGCRPYVFAGGLTGGLGIRGDDQTRGLIVHHNVVWDCDRDGIIVKGDFNEVSYNTVFGIGTGRFGGNGLSLHTEPEPHKPWARSTTPLLAVQNQHTRAENNAVTTFTCDRVGTPFPLQDGIDHNFVSAELAAGAQSQLADPAHFDFRPRAGSALIDAGTVIDGITGKVVGRAPDIGAYERGGKNWEPGARTASVTSRDHVSEDAAAKALTQWD